jgi:hypothetical protein
MKNQMPFNNEIEKTKKEIDVLTAKLELLKEMENPTPVEEAYKRVFGAYPPTDPSVHNFDDNQWFAFQKGYSCGYGDGLENSNDFAIPKKIVDKPEDIQQPNGDFIKQYPDVTRVEVIGNDGREFVHYGCSNVKVSLQDDGRTIKVFLYTMFQQEEPKPMDDVIDRLVEKYKSQKLWNMMRNELGYSIDCTEEIVDAVEGWLVKEQISSGSQNVNTELLVDGFNDCVRKMKEMLR